MASREKKPPFTEIDLAIIATAPASQKKGLIRAATGERGYDFYRGFRVTLATILNAPIGPLIPASPSTNKQIVTAVSRACNNGQGEVANNKAIAEALFDYVAAHNVIAAPFNFDPVSLGRAGKRSFWAPYVLMIDGKRYIPFFDPRRDNGLMASPRRFFFSINHTHIRLGNPTEWGDVGFVIFQFEDSKERKVITHFDHGITFWTDAEIAAMGDEVYRLLDEIR